MQGELLRRLSVGIGSHSYVVVVVVDYPTPSEGWGHGGRPWSPRIRETPRGWTRGRREIESRQRVSGAKSP